MSLHLPIWLCCVYKLCMDIYGRVDCSFYVDFSLSLPSFVHFDIFVVVARNCKIGIELDLERAIIVCIMAYNRIVHIYN